MKASCYFRGIMAGEDDDGLNELNERELLSALLYEVKAIRAKVDATADDLLHFRKEMGVFQERTEGFQQEMYEFKKEMYEFKDGMYDFRRETNNNFNKLDRRLRFVEADYDQLNERVDKLETAPPQ
jgi:chromosome segregation ATPase